MSERTEHSNASVRVLDLVVTDDRMSTWLDGHTFRDCEVVGPAVLVIVEKVTIHESDLDVAQLWEIDPSRSYVGGVGLRNCAFHNCSFRDVGFATDGAYWRRMGAPI